MIETPFGNIHGIEDETITMEDLRNVFKAVEKGMITRISYCEDISPYKQRTFEISKVVRCKNCKHRPEVKKYVMFGKEEEYYVFPEGSKCPCQISDNYYSWNPDDDFFCADGEEKEGKSE